MWFNSLCLVHWSHQIVCVGSINCDIKNNSPTNVAPSMCRSISAMLRVQALCLYQVGIRRDHMNPSMVRSRPLTCIMFIDQSRRLGALICPVVLATIFTQTQTQTHTNTHTELLFRVLSVKWSFNVEETTAICAENLDLKMRGRLMDKLWTLVQIRINYFQSGAFRSLPFEVQGKVFGEGFSSQ